MKPKTKKDKLPRFIKQTHIPIKLLITASVVTLTACASVNQHERGIDAILEKESALIEKLEAERASPEVAQAILRNGALQASERHLLLALGELKEAHKTIRSKILKSAKEETKDER